MPAWYAHNGMLQCGQSSGPGPTHGKHTTMLTCLRCCSSLPCLCPAALLIYFLGIAFPFYGAINSLMSALSGPATAFVLPAVAFNVVFKSKAARENAVSPPPTFLQVIWVLFERENATGAAYMLPLCCHSLFTGCSTQANQLLEVLPRLTALPGEKLL